MGSSTVFQRGMRARLLLGVTTFPRAGAAQNQFQQNVCSSGDIFTPMFLGNISATTIYV